jgi:hypothetical protein
MTRIAASLAVVALALVFTPQVRTSAQTAPPTADAGPTTLGLGTILGDFPYFAGQLVRIPTARVREVLSPRVFTVEPWVMYRSEMGARALVVADKPALDLKPGVVVEIVGRPWTFEGARKGVSGTWLEDLDEGDRKHFASHAVIGADLVRTPGRVEMGVIR